MTKQNLLSWIVVIAAITLLGAIIAQIHPRVARADRPVWPDQRAKAAQPAAVPAVKCMECHHSETLSRVDQVTTDPTPDLRPAWSPDGSKIVFDSNRTGSYDIWIMNADGSGQKQLTNGQGSEMFASFNRDGSRVIFYGYDTGRNDIWTIDINGDNLVSLTSNLADESNNQCTFACHTPTYSPDGATIAFHADQDGTRNIWLMDADGSNLRQLTQANSNSDINNYLPSWSPDGRIIFQAEKPVALTIRTDIRMINPDGSDEITLFAEVAHGGPFIWSPDGTRVALHSQRGGAGNFDIYVATFGEAAEAELPLPEEEQSTPVEESPASDEEITTATVAENSADIPEEAATTFEETVTTSDLPGILAIGGGLLALILVGVFGWRKFKGN